MPGPTILICEDEPTLRELIRISLGAGYMFAEAADVGGALEVVGRVKPDLVLVDVMMPGGSGLAVIERLRSDPELSHTPAVVVSAFSTDADRLAAQEAGADGFLMKPFEPEELAALVEELIASHR